MTDSQSPPSWPLESSEQVAEYEMFDVRHDRVRNPQDGSTHDYHIAESPDAVVVVALAGEGELILIEQFRHGLRELSLEVPAGIVDEGEDPVEAGLRELREETGFTAERGELLGTIELNPSWQSLSIHVVLVREVGRREAKELDSGEDTRVRCLPRERVREMVRQGEIRSATSVAALYLLDLQG